jgi:hypothetical protein
VTIQRAGVISGAGFKFGGLAQSHVVAASSHAFLAKHAK